MTSVFEQLGLLPPFIEAVEQLGYKEPTPIQREAIPALLAGRDLIGQAQTGTGKTAAFALPMLQKIMVGSDEKAKKTIRALVLAPTRELAIQVAKACTQIGKHASVRVAAVYGGQSYTIQIRQIERGVDVVVGTPGRLLDLIDQRILDLSHVEYVILDEADEMLDMGFIEDIESILSKLAPERQMGLFSATLPAPVRKLAEKYQHNPQQISINPTHITVAETEQRCYRIRDESKFPALTRLLEVEELKSALIFTRTKVRAQELADQLIERGFTAEALHGDLNQARREFVLNRFRQGGISVLVATDVAARGLDIDDVSHVINYDAPQGGEDYVHRIGRTGRAGRKGIAITFFLPKERGLRGSIEAYTRQSIQECKVPTQAEIQSRRDQRFIEQLTEQLGKGKIGRERALIAQLQNTSFDLVDIAAAAMQLARAGEAQVVDDGYVEAIAESKSAWKTDKKGQSNRRERGGFERDPRDVFPVGKKGNRNHQQEPDMVRLTMDLGNSHGVRPSDVVGAIASEVGIPGRAIGEIDIRAEHTFIDVSAQHVQQVLRASHGQYFLRGKPVMLRLA